MHGSTRQMDPCSSVNIYLMRFSNSFGFWFFLCLFKVQRNNNKIYSKYNPCNLTPRYTLLMLLVYVVFTDRNDHNWILKILWTYLHLRSLHRVAVTFPKEPRHSLTTDLSVKVQTIQVGVVAIVIPPCAFIFHGTVTTTVIVIVTIFGGKWLSSVYTKGISSGTLKNDKNNTLNYSVPIFHMMNERLLIWILLLTGKNQVTSKIIFIYSSCSKFCSNSFTSF